MTDLFRAAADIARPLGVKKPDPDLKYYDYSDIGLGWALSIGYTVDWDGSDCSAWIHTVELNTGQRLIPLALNEIPGDELRAIEGLIADDEYQAAYEAAKALHESRDDYGDWLYEQRKDKEA